MRRSTALFEGIGREFGGLDFLVHGAAYAPREELASPFVNTSRDGFRVALDVSAYSLVALARRAVPLMAARGGGSILTLTYLGSDRVFTNYNVMGVAKAALECSVRYLASDLGPQNIRVNAISAGPIKTLAAVGHRRVLEHPAGVPRPRAAPAHRRNRRGGRRRALPARAGRTRDHRRSADGRRRVPRDGHLVCSGTGRRTEMTRSTYLTSLLLALVLVAPLLVGACGKTVGETIDDGTVTARVKTALLEDPVTGGMRIDVDTFKGVVTLSGRVKSSQEQATAVNIARRTPGVQDVKSTLQIQP